ncbi:MAG: hypothetical protein RMI01_08905 [Thermodesulfovibrio sp.]|nr:hypothetical protein [Thermodesulfovibrio sp.]
MAHQPWHQNILSRVFGGGEQVGPFTADPYVKGYGFVYIEPLSLGIIDANTSLTLSALARAVNLTNITLEAETIEGMAGVRFTHPTKLSMPDRITIEFMEVQDAFVMNTFKRWVTAIRDIRFGASNLVGGVTRSPNNSSLTASNGQYGKKKFATTIHVIITLPDATTPIQVICFTGAYPLTIPLEHYGFNIADNTKADIPIEFAIDNVYFVDMSDPMQKLSPEKFITNQAYKNIVEKVKNIKTEFFNACSR